MSIVLSVMTVAHNVPLTITMVMPNVSAQVEGVQQAVARRAENPRPSTGIPPTEKMDRMDRMGRMGRVPVGAVAVVEVAEVKAVVAEEVEEAAARAAGAAGEVVGMEATDRGSNNSFGESF